MTQTQETRPDVVDFLTDDHALMLDLLDLAEQAVDPATRRDLTDTVIAEVMRHSVAEEMHVYPVVEKHVPGGADDVEHDKHEHDEIVSLMKTMEDTDAGSVAFVDQIRELRDQLRHHAEDEESEQFPKLRRHVPAEDLLALREKVLRAMERAPTRPHPSAPHSEFSTRPWEPASAWSTGYVTT